VAVAVVEQLDLVLRLRRGGGEVAVAPGTAVLLVQEPAHAQDGRDGNPRAEAHRHDHEDQDREPADAGPPGPRALLGSQDLPVVADCQAAVPVLGQKALLLGHPSLLGKNPAGWQAKEPTGWYERPRPQNPARGGRTNP
jgi:hypothetical protein